MEFLILAIIVQKFCHYFWKLLPLFFNILAIIVEYFGHYCWKIWPLLLKTFVILVEFFGHYCWKFWPLLFKILAIIVENFGYYQWIFWPLLLVQNFVFTASLYSITRNFDFTTFCHRFGTLTIFCVYPKENFFLCLQKSCTRQWIFYKCLGISHIFISTSTFKWQNIFRF